MTNENELVKSTIDYLKVTFYFEDFNIGRLTKNQKELFKILKLDPLKFEENYRVRGYNKTYEYDEDILIGCDPANKGNVEEYVEHYCLEISGSPYHQLEERGVDMLSLLKFCNSLPHKVGRIDIAIDDFGIMDIKTIKSKINNDIYTSSFRAIKKGGKRANENNESLYDQVIQDYIDKMGFRPHYIDGRKGYSATWGSRKNGATELQFYDKVAERLVNGLGVTLDQWLRFEMRFGRLGLKGDYVLENAIKAIEEEKFGEFSKSLLSGLIEFKEVPKGQELINIKENRNMNNCPIWRDYKKFLDNAEKVKVPYKQASLEKSVERSVNWARNDWTSTLIKFGLTGKYDIQNQGIVEYIKKKGLSFKVLSEARNYLMSKEGRLLSDGELLENLQVMIDSYCEDCNEINLKEEYNKLVNKNKRTMSAAEEFIDDIINGEED